MPINHHYDKSTPQNPVSDPVPDSAADLPKKESPVKKACRTCGDLFEPNCNSQKFCENCSKAWSVTKRKNEAKKLTGQTEKIIETLIDERDLVMQTYAMCRDFKGKNFEISFNGVRITICKSN